MCVQLDPGWNAHRSLVLAVRSLWLALDGTCYYCVAVFALLGGTFFAPTGLRKYTSPHDFVFGEDEGWDAQLSKCSILWLVMQLQ